MGDIAPTCSRCRSAARLTSGREIYQHRPDLAAKPIWKCDGCGAYCGCHPSTTRPLGTLADAETRRARMQVHAVLDPLWKTADKTPGYAPDSEKARARIRLKARNRVYAYLADRLGVPREECHTGMFDRDRCAEAIRALAGITYSEIRVWSQDCRAVDPRPRATREPDPDHLREDRDDRRAMTKECPDDE